MLGKAWRWFLGAILILGLAWFAIHQYGDARVASEKANTLDKVVQEAVVERKATVKADASVQREIVAKRVPVRSRVALATTEREQNDSPETTVAGCADSAEYLRLLNNAIDAGNEAIESASRLP